MKQKIFSVTAKDCRWDYYNGTGKGGQNRNKCAKCVRCFHDPSGAMGKAEDERSLEQNKRLAFRRMAETEKFKKWCKIEASRLSGELAVIEEKIDQELKTGTVVEAKDDQGKWVKAPDLDITDNDIKNLREET